MIVTYLWYESYIEPEGNEVWTLAVDYWIQGPTEKPEEAYADLVQTALCYVKSPLWGSVWPRTRRKRQKV